MSLPRSVTAVATHRDLLALLVERDLKVRTKRSVLGMAWTLMNPLLQMGVFTVVFSTVLRVGVPAFPVFVLAGLLPWSLLAASTTAGSLALVHNQSLIRKVAVPQAVYPLAVVGSKLVDVALSLLPLAAIGVVFGRPPGAAWLLVAPALAVAVVFAAGLALLFASLTVFFRDLRHLLEVVLPLWFYATPILYPAEYLERVPVPALRAALALNPATPIVAWFQAAVWEGRPPAATTAAAAIAIAIGSLALGATVFDRLEPSHVHHL